MFWVNLCLHWDRLCMCCKPMCVPTRSAAKVQSLCCSIADWNQDFRVNGQGDCCLLNVSAFVTRSAHRSRHRCPQQGNTAAEYITQRITVWFCCVLWKHCVWLLCCMVLLSNNAQVNLTLFFLSLLSWHSHPPLFVLLTWQRMVYVACLLVLFTAHFVVFFISKPQSNLWGPAC